MSSDDSSIRLEGVSKAYKRYDRPVDRLKGSLFRGRASYHRDFWALRDVDLSVRRGTTLAVVGVNGSGKSTLLQLIAGILQPTSGRVHVEGRVAALLELGAGFNPEMTGRENAYINGAILGIGYDEMKDRMEAILRFADIGEFIDHPVKTYSSGMYVRLAFAVAINVDPQILLIDETLSVGDMYFQHRCLTKINQLQSQGKTIVFVSHDLGFTVTLASQAAWIHEGRLVECGLPESIITKYMAMVASRELRERRSEEPSAPPLVRESTEGTASESFPHRPETVIPNVDVRYGNRKAEVIGVGIYDDQGQRISSAEAGQSIVFRVSTLFHADVKRPIVGVLIKNRMGLYLTGTNTLMEGCQFPAQAKGDICTTEFHLVLPVLAPGNYSFVPAISEGTLEDYAVCDWIENAYVLEIISPTLVHGLLRIPCEVVVQGVRWKSISTARSS
jgi:homopolymeric O-antigen transport system ATP-binding protein